MARRCAARPTGGPGGLRGLRARAGGPPLPQRQLARGPPRGPQGHRPDPAASRYWPRRLWLRLRLTGNSSSPRAGSAVDLRPSGHWEPGLLACPALIGRRASGPAPSTRYLSLDSPGGRVGPPPVRGHSSLARRVVPASGFAPPNLRGGRAHDRVVRLSAGQWVLCLLGRLRPGKSGGTRSPQWRCGRRARMWREDR